MSVLHLLNATGGGELLRNRPLHDHGRWTDKFVTLANFPVRRPYAPNGAELMLAERLETKVTHITYTEWGRDVQRGDQFLIESITYDVTAVLPPSKEHHLKVMLEKRQHGATT